MQFDPRRRLLQRRPFVRRLLHPVLAEEALARRQRRTDAPGAEGLRHGDEAHLRRVAARVAGGGGDARPHGGEIGGDIDGVGHDGRQFRNTR